MSFKVLFETQRLLIVKALTNEHLTPLLPIYNDVKTMQYIPSKRDTPWTIQDIKDKYNINQKLYTDGLGLYLIYLKKEGKNECLGELCLLNYASNTAFVEIGYIIHQTYWRQGLGTELILATLKYIHKNVPQRTNVIAQLFEKNIASAQLLYKTDFKFQSKEKLQHGEYKLIFHYDL